MRALNFCLLHVTIFETLSSVLPFSERTHNGQSRISKSVSHVADRDVK